MSPIFAALADPTRCAVVEQLAEKSASVSDLHARHDIALPTFLRHLKVLENNGLITSRKEGRVRFVAINPEPLAQMQDWLAQYKAHWDTRLDRLERLAKNMERTRS